MVSCLFRTARGRVRCAAHRLVVEGDAASLGFGFAGDYLGLDWCPARAIIAILQFDVVKVLATCRAKCYRA